MDTARTKYIAAYNAVREAVDRLRSATAASEEAAKRGEKVDLDSAINGVIDANKRCDEALKALRNGGRRTRRHRRNRKTRRRRS